MKKFKKDQIWLSPRSVYTYLIEDCYIDGEFALKFRYASGKFDFWTATIKETKEDFQHLIYIGEL